MGGRIWAESTLGSGTTMHFTARFSIACRRRPKPAQEACRARTLGLCGFCWPTIRRRIAFSSAATSRIPASIIDEVENGAQAVEQFKQRRLRHRSHGRRDACSGWIFRHARNPRAWLDAHFPAHRARFPRSQGTQFRCRLHGAPDEADQESHVARRPSTSLFQLGDRVQVSVESWLKPVVGGYLEKRRGDVAKLREALDRGDFEAIRTLGHQMAGTGGGIRFRARSPKLAARWKSPRWRATLRASGQASKIWIITWAPFGWSKV